MTEKIQESKRIAIFAFCLLLLSLLIVASWLFTLSGASMDAEVQRTLVGALRDAVSYGLPVLIAGVSATDWREAQASTPAWERVAAAPDPKPEASAL